MFCPGLMVWEAGLESQDHSACPQAHLQTKREPVLKSATQLYTDSPLGVLRCICFGVYILFPHQHQSTAFSKTNVMDSKARVPI
jgi:hypothetical protein